MKVSIQLTDKNARMPDKAYPGDSGFDLYSIDDEILAPGEFRLIHTGIKLEMSEGLEAQIRPRSGLALNHGVTVLNTPGTIDSHYRGQIGVILINHNRRRNFVVSKGMKIAQMVFAKVMPIELKEVDKINNTERAAKGFGSSGE